MTRKFSVIVLLCIFASAYSFGWDGIFSESEEDVDPFGYDRDNYPVWSLMPRSEARSIGYNEDGVLTILHTPQENTITFTKGVDRETSQPSNTGERRFDNDNTEKNTDSTKIEEFAEKLDQLMSKVKSQEDIIAVLEKSITKLQGKVDILEQQMKANRLIFFNVNESKNESFRTTLQKVLHIINRIMKVRISSDDISIALRTSTNLTSDKNRPIVVQFTNFVDRMKVISAANRLSQGEIKVTPDYSEEIVKRRNLLLPYLQAAREQGHSAFILYDKLVIDGEKKTLEQLQREAEVSSGEDPQERPPQPQVPESRTNPDEQVEEVEVDPQFQDNEYDE